ncbi:probable receptor expression-enhancing protein 4 [Rhynchosporium agropyri]|uniref:Protein YOP1 n=2 Tax=Rhynchosporium TaxID=38037 RepID=A0A1E1M214_RHYSE|nr:probable receptor expression-enhancing protein 4 [Rhynchosporium agropyri]CZT43153.1 probable receptor expression-enhancing protein 4 [Rhynchosporium secalis]
MNPAIRDHPTLPCLTPDSTSTVEWSGVSGMILTPLINSSIPTFLFPVFASYKALRTSDPALLTPWLMYWVVLACALFVESWTGFILFWIPFYAWFRLGFLLYLILPQTQGAKVLYQSHVHPFLEENERSIDDFISSAHDRAKAAGYTYFKQAIELIKQHLLGLPPKEPSPPATPSTFSYTQNLLARFNLPSARPAFPTMPATNTATDFYSLLASAVTAATSRDPASASSQSRDLSNSGMLIPPSVSGEERLSFIAAQRERLSILLSALDKEANALQGHSVKPSTPRQVPSMFFDGSSGSEQEERPISSMSGLTSRKSEADFEKIEAESGAEEVETVRRQIQRSSGSASWMPWSWGGKTDGPADTEMSGTHTPDDKGKSSGVDA